MPDLDILRKGISGHFVASCRLIRGGADDDMVLAASRRALAQSFIRGGGIPNLRARAALIVAVGIGGSVSDAVRGSRDLLVADEGKRNAHLADRALRRLLLDRYRPASEVEAAHQLAQFVAHELFDHRLLASLRLESTDLGMTPDEFDSYAARLHRGLEPAIDQLARQLVADPSGASVRTPGSPARTRPSTRDILNQAV
jgi:hypothetical protein